MPDLGKKYTCYSCHTKFYDLGKPVPLCPKCGADQRDAEEAPAAPASRSRSRAPVVVEEPIEEPEFSGEGESESSGGGGDEDEEAVVPEREEPEEEDEEEEEY